MVHDGNVPCGRGELPRLARPHGVRDVGDVGLELHRDERGPEFLGVRASPQGEGALVVPQRAGVRLGLGMTGEHQYAHGSYCPIAWTPPSTWMTAPVVAGNQSDRSAVTARAVGSGSLESHPSGARAFQPFSISSKPGMCLAAVVMIGPAETRL